MTKKKTKEGSGKARVKSQSAARPTRKSNKKTDDAVKELMGVHVINSQDIENHFGTSETESGNESEQSSARRPKTDVRLQLDAQIWQEAQTAAARAKLELAQYVESALARFKDDPAK